MNPEARISAIDGNNYSADIVFSTKNPGAAGNAIQDRMRITANGNVGIGTNAPVATFHNSGSTVFGALVIGNLAGGGAIGTPAATVNIKTTFNINQTTANQTLTLPAPTDATA